MSLSHYPDRTLHAVTFLAPNMLPVYQFIIDSIGQQLGCTTELVIGSDYEEIYDADLSFICGLPYILRTSPRITPSPIEAIAAPVLQGERYQDKPIYFSDVIVHRDSPFQAFADLCGHSWAYNEPDSQSGCGMIRYAMVKRGETNGYFSQVLRAYYHQAAIRMVCNGEVDAAAIDSQVLAVELRDQPHLAEQLRVIESFGPSTIQPLTVSSRLPDRLKADIQSICAELHTDPRAKDILAHRFIDRFTAVCDSDYDDIRAMLAACEAANFLILR